MRKAMPRITESADALQHCMQSEPDHKKRQRLPALYRAASGQARHRQARAALLGGHRPSVAAGLRAYAEGGFAHTLRSVHPRITAAAFAALHDQRKDPPGFASSHQRRAW